MFRERLAQFFRDRVAGPDAEERAERIWRTPGERWFTDDDPIARVNGAGSMYVGGIRALLLQSLHPLPMEAVVQFSNYQGDPWTRLQTTAYYVAETTYGRVADATALINRVRQVHTHIHGTTPNGRRFDACDPHQLMWVHVAEIDSFLTAYQMYSGTPLTPAEEDTYVEQAAVPARLLGVVDPPTTVAEMKTILADYTPELKLTPGAAGVVEFMTSKPPVPAYLRPGFAMFVAGAIASLPTQYRAMLQVPTSGNWWRHPMGKLATTSVTWSLGHAHLEIPTDGKSGAPA
ncbi:MAG: oxygenase MpaB family protein [Corynebacterium sp.]|nr:oxygenase MpaB family protein [Corynebacterium sp.]